MSIDVPNFGKLSALEEDARNFLHRTTVLYGSSGTGKTTMIYWIMKLLRDYIPTVIVICPTADANGSYKKVLPDPCIFRTISTTRINSILKHQDQAAQTYRCANSIETLESLYRMTGDTKMSETLHAIEQIAARYGDEHPRIDEINEKKRKLYKDVISNHIELLKQQELTEDQRVAIKFLRYNPNILLIMDDCAADIKAWGKGSDIYKVFYNGRHMFMTSLFSMQNDKAFEPAVRRNAFVNIFTEPQSANCFFKSTTNGLTNYQREVEALCNYIFKQPYMKLVYKRDTSNRPFRYARAERISGMIFGNTLLWKMCERISEKDKEKCIKSYLKA